VQSGVFYVRPRVEVLKSLRLRTKISSLA